MPKTTAEKTSTKVTLDIRPGPVTPHMKMAWRVWWTRLVSSVREELDREEGNKHA